MKLSELYANLSYGMLANLRMGGDGSGTIPAEYQDRLLHHVNRGLTALHSKFLMVAKQVVIRAYDGVTLYPLEPRYADTNPTVVTRKHISDSVYDPFLGDVIKVLVVHDENGMELPLNDSTEERSIFTPSSDVVQIPYAVTGDAYFVTYQANHPTLLPGDLTQEVTIPEMLEEPLELYIAYRVLSSMNGQEHAAKAIEHYQRYQQLCTEIEQRDTLSTSQVEGTCKFHLRGFV